MVIGMASLEALEGEMRDVAVKLTAQRACLQKWENRLIELLEPSRTTAPGQAAHWIRVARGKMVKLERELRAIQAQG
jgi:hypothetical protein